MSRCLKCLCGLVDCLIKRSFHSSLQLAGEGGGRSGLDRRSVFTATRPVGPATVAGCRRHAEKTRHATQECIFPITSRHRENTLHHTLHLATLPCITPHHTTHHTTSRYFQLRHITDHMKPRHCIALHYVTLRHSTQYITSCDVILYYITQYCTT